MDRRNLERFFVGEKIKSMTDIHFGVPYKFRIRQAFKYPSHNENFEEWFLDNYCEEDIVPDRQYLPIFWNGYHVGHNYGNDPVAVSDIQNFVDGLDQSKKYWTIHQFDLGTMVDFKDLDIICFGMSGGRIDVPIPLVCLPHAWNLGTVKTNFLNFVGRSTHPIREVIFSTIRHGGSNYIAQHNHQPRNYCQIIAASTFTLAVRGFGKTSFRMAEALQYESIPVYITDEAVLPFNIPFDEYGVFIEAKDVHRTEGILQGIYHHEIEKKRTRGKEIYQEYFTYEGCKRNILKHLRSE
jgi:hypothetical protein